ncbi:MAG: MBL fold metallo-hydrolase [Verrucomicrobiae bacterium]|nr:MBL fold metallo-hydrolase [Verrucomicrobiae bacterium]
MQMELEDTFSDVIGKAQRGLGLDDRALARKSGVGAEVLSGLKAGRFDEAGLGAVAGPLGLDRAALLALGKGAYPPPEGTDVAGVETFTSAFDGMRVNAYLVWNPATRAGIAFDTGTDGGPMLEFVGGRGIRVPLILLTHTHDDHVAELARLREGTGAHVFVSASEPLDGCETFAGDHRFKIGGLEVATRATTGHSAGGTTYVISGLERPVAVVGDALFAGSMGGGFVSFRDALRTNREAIFTLPDETILCPGHGPRTTVGHEKRHNPFFAGGAAGLG